MSAENRGQCATIGCEKPASSMQCPTCLKYERQSFFCSQDCFKGGWALHKFMHKPKSDAAFAGFKFTGPLRVGTVSDRRSVPREIPRPDYADDPEGVPHSELSFRSNAIVIHNEEEIATMKEACRLGREVLDIAGDCMKPGVTTEEVDIAVHKACLERKCYPSPLNYRGFPKSCCTSVNEVICHGIPDSRKLEDGDICNVDITVYYKGFHADLNETFFVGNVDDVSRRLVKTTYECLEMAIAKVKPGELYRNMGNVITRHASAEGFSVVRSYCGHGIGRLFHTNPNVPHYSKNKAVGVMKPGHIFTIEPMINVGTYHDVLWPDDWTSTTRDGKRSAQFEHTLLVTETGCEVLTKRIEGRQYGPTFYVPS